MKKGTILYGAVCFALGAAICGGTTAYAAGVMAERSTDSFYVDGHKIELLAYTINGNNYVKLRDVGEVVNFNVYWNGTVHIESDKPYTGVAPEDDPLDENMDIRLEIVRLANEERKKAGVPALTVNDALMDAAQDCAQQGFTNHDTKYESLTVPVYAATAIMGCGTRTGRCKISVRPYRRWRITPASCGRRWCRCGARTRNVSVTPTWTTGGRWSTHAPPRSRRGTGYRWSICAGTPRCTKRRSTSTYTWWCSHLIRRRGISLSRASGTSSPHLQRASSSRTSCTPTSAKQSTEMRLPLFFPLRSVFYRRNSVLFLKIFVK